MFILGQELNKYIFHQLLNGALESYCGLHVATVSFGSGKNLTVKPGYRHWAGVMWLFPTIPKAPGLKLKEVPTPPTQTRTVNDANGIISFSCDQYIQGFSGLEIHLTVDTGAVFPATFDSDWNQHRSDALTRPRFTSTCLCLCVCPCKTDVNYAFYPCLHLLHMSHNNEHTRHKMVAGKYIQHSFIHTFS